ncbi:MAG: ribbon-helix-helix domain-containing protein [archaeon GB-1867-005]|nr:ribbon-helix-helix domain-containing protein [Candidatus Culexmicrobium cathedralense]
MVDVSFGVRVSVSIDEELLEWAKKQVETRKFRSVSHVVEYALMLLKKLRRNNTKI